MIICKHKGVIIFNFFNIVLVRLGLVCSSIGTDLLVKIISISCLIGPVCLFLWFFAIAPQCPWCIPIIEVVGQNPPWNVGPAPAGQAIGKSKHLYTGINLLPPDGAVLRYGGDPVFSGYDATVQYPYHICRSSSEAKFTDEIDLDDDIDKTMHIKGQVRSVLCYVVRYRLISDIFFDIYYRFATICR